MALSNKSLHALLQVLDLIEAIIKKYNKLSPQENTYNVDEKGVPT